MDAFPSGDVYEDVEQRGCKANGFPSGDVYEDVEKLVCKASPSGDVHGFASGHVAFE